MRKLLLFSVVLFTNKVLGQCPDTINLSGQGENCLGTTLTVGLSGGSKYNQIVWYDNGTAVNTVTAAPGSTNGVTVAGGNGGGSANNALCPGGLIVDGNGNIYVTDINNNRIQMWAPGATAGLTIAGGNGSGSAPNQFDGPLGLAVDKNGNLYVADELNYRVQMWAPGATEGITVAGGNGRGTADNQLYWPCTVVVDNAGNVYVGDESGRLMKWPPGASSGILVAGGNGSQLAPAYGLAMDGAGNFFITSGNQVEKWAPGATAGVIVAGVGGWGSAANQLMSPITIFVDPQDNVYVGDYGNERILEFAPGATNGITVAGGNGQGSAADQFFCPQGIFVDANGNLYVNDVFNYRVQKWPVATINRTYTPPVPGIYTAIVTANGGCSMSTNAVIINPIVTPSVNISASNTTVTACTTLSFTASPTNGGPTPSYEWQINGVDSGANNPNFNDVSLKNDAIVTCTMTSDAACTTTATAVSTPISIKVTGVGPPSIMISASEDSSCSGTPVQFTAVVEGGATNPIYQWQVNSNPVGSNTNVYSADSLSDKDSVTCTVSTDGACASGISNSIIVTIFPIPVIPQGQVFSTTGGQSILLNPVVDGEIGSYAWHPGAGLSDSTILNPLATPLQNTTYELDVVSINGCVDGGKISVQVYTEIKVPNAFTPNGDGKNDVFYVLGGSTGSRIDQLDIFNRWGQIIFAAQNIMPGDASVGWDGTNRGQPAPVGTYIYIISISDANGRRSVYRGTVELIR